MNSRPSSICLRLQCVGFALALFSLALKIEAADSSPCFSSSVWTNRSFALQTGTFAIEFDAVPQGPGVDSVVGLSYGAAVGYTNLAAIVRFFTNGLIDARSGSGYTSDHAIHYVAN